MSSQGAILHHRSTPDGASRAREQPSVQALGDARPPASCSAALITCLALPAAEALTPSLIAEGAIERPRSARRSVASATQRARSIEARAQLPLIVGEAGLVGLASSGTVAALPARS